MPFFSHDDDSLPAGFSMALISLRELKVHASVGILAHEKAARQPLVCNLDVWVRLAEDRKDRISEVLDYRKLRELALGALTEGHTNLLETAAECVANQILKLPQVIAVRARIEKPNAFDDAAAVGVELIRRNNVS